MHPAFSVIAFTSLSGAGYGLLFWLGLLVAIGQAARNPALALSVLAIAAVLIATGLLSSMAHLGRPERAWRAFSQWRSSWLSREGVLASLSFLPLIGLGVALALPASRAWLLILAALNSVLAVATVYCTARIYDTLVPIPAWHNRWVLPNYLALAAASGAICLWAIGVLGFAVPAHRGDVVILVALLGVASALKLGYWRSIDRRPARIDAAAALGLPAGSRVAVFEQPHTEANFLMKEMGFALARKHARRLRRLTVLLLAIVPGVALCAAAIWPLLRPHAAVVAVPSTMLAVLVERWLFFAQARHLVATYYDAAPG